MDKATLKQFLDKELDEKAKKLKYKAVPKQKYNTSKDNVLTTVKLKSKKLKFEKPKSKKNK